MSDVPALDVVTFPCGCLLMCSVNEGVNEMRVSPCNRACDTLHRVLDLALDANIPIEKRIAP